MKKVLTLILILLAPYWLVGQAIINVSWQKALGGTGLEVAYSIKRTSDGGYIVAGETNSNNGDVSGNYGGTDCWVVKLSFSGAVEWKKILGGSANERYGFIIQTSDGGYIVSIGSRSNDGDASGNHGKEDAWIAKLSSSGTIDWQKSIGGTENDLGSSIIQVSSGGYLIAGVTSSNNGDVSGNHGGSDLWIIKLNINGGIEWQRTLGGTSNEQANSVVEVENENFVIAGRTESNNGDVSGNHGGSDFWVIKINNSGHLIWQKTLGGSAYDQATSVTSSSDGGYVISGLVDSIDGDVSGNHGSTDCWVVKINANGIVEWKKSLGGSGADVGVSIFQTFDGGYIMGGYSNSNDGDVSGNHGSSDCWVVKLDNIGGIEWQKSLGGTGGDYAYSITTTAGGYVVAGASNSNNGDVSGNHGDFDFWVASLSVRNFTVSPNYPCQDKYVKLTSEGCAGTTRWYAYPEGQTPTLIHTGINYNYLVPNTIPLSTAIFFKAECTTTSGFLISMGAPKFVRVLGASSYNFVSPTDDFTSTPPYPLKVANSITAANKILAPNPPIPLITTRVEYRAEKGILLKPGFRADKGTVFTAQIGGCQ
jgi:hypothetical protein